MKRETLATGSVLGVSFLIASCCLGPALFLLFGVSIGALGWFSTLEPYRPFLIVIGASLLAYAGFRVYRPGSDEGGSERADDACAPSSQRRRGLRLLFMIAAALYVIAIVFPYAIEALI